MHIQIKKNYNYRCFELMIYICHSMWLVIKYLSVIDW